MYNFFYLKCDVNRVQRKSLLFGGLKQLCVLVLVGINFRLFDMTVRICFIGF